MKHELANNTTAIKIRKEKVIAFYNYNHLLKRRDPVKWERTFFVLSRISMTLVIQI
jgi:hypothetical protein